MYPLCIFLYILSYLCFIRCIKKKKNVSQRCQFFIPHISKEGIYNSKDNKIIRMTRKKSLDRNVVCSNGLSEFIEKDININNKMKNIRELNKKYIDNNVLIKADIFSNIMEKKNNTNLFLKKFCSYINMEYDETTRDFEELKINKHLDYNNINMYDNKSNNIYNNNNNSYSHSHSHSHNNCNSNCNGLIKCIEKNQDILQLVEGYLLLTLKNKHIFSFLKNKKRIIFSVSSGVDSLCLFYSFIFVIYKILISIIYKNENYFDFMNKINSVYLYTHQDILDIIEEHRYKNNVSFFLSILNKMIVIYCHHNTRKECTSEMYFLKSVCKKFGINFKSKKLTEKSLEQLNVINLKKNDTKVKNKININMMKNNKKNFLLLARTWRRNIYVHLSDDILKRDTKNMENMENVYNMKNMKNMKNMYNIYNINMKDPFNMLDPYTYEKYIFDINNYIKITNKKYITNILIKKEKFLKEYNKNDYIMRKKKNENLLFKNLMNLPNNNKNHSNNIKYKNIFLNKYYILKKKIKSIVFLGHHKNDNNETVLLQFFRGVFLKNLRGIKFLTYYKNCLLYRPFIKLNKCHLYKYMQVINKTWNFDSSNNNLSRSRNFIRKVLIPNITHILKDKSHKNREDYNVDKQINNKNDKDIIDDNIIVDNYNEKHIFNKKDMNKYDNIEISKNNIVDKTNELKNQHVYINPSLDKRLKNVLSQTTNLENYLNYYDNMFFTYLKKKYYKKGLNAGKRITHEEDKYINMQHKNNRNNRNNENIINMNKSYNTYKNVDNDLVHVNVHLKKKKKDNTYQDAHNIFMNEYFKMQNNLYNIFFPTHKMETLIKINKILYEKNIYLKIFNFFELLLIPSKLIRLEILYNIIKKYAKVNIKYVNIERLYEQMIAYINQYIKMEKKKYYTNQYFYKSHISNDDDNMLDNKMNVQNKKINAKIKDLFGDERIEGDNFIIINITKSKSILMQNNLFRIIERDMAEDLIKRKKGNHMDGLKKGGIKKGGIKKGGIKKGGIKKGDNKEDDIKKGDNKEDDIKKGDNKEDDIKKDDNKEDDVKKGEIQKGYIQKDYFNIDRKDTHIQHGEDISSEKSFLYNKTKIVNENHIKTDEYNNNLPICFKEKSANIFVYNNISTEVSRLKKYDITQNNDKKNIFLLIKKRKKKKKEKFNIHIRYIKKNDYVYLEKKKINVNKFLALHNIPYIYRTALPVIEISNFNNNHILFFYIFTHLKSPYFTLREKTFPQKYMNTHFVYNIKFKKTRG
ncbi:conserved Plasmodium protein, unknown function [Plasmodium sp. gorilla clade G2]|uniref:conserved Plasmodium protein, unknown function n=1 Tax=Plasmodium sp. gorilla clade G2 TaxID=880535 RepID=UPI000D2064EB|nr:conserved Plasmodium protein, unknown function [Plasmodium sp. gorilla clade G2]SOV11351.1 conserved Plasmodium protein, unknown function [Plasmodium sp. gorilla clade G2]